MNRVILLLQAILLTLLLSACGAGESSDDSSQAHGKLPIAKVSYSDWQLLDESHGINGGAWQLEQCDACHLIADIHQKPEQAVIKDIVLDKGYQTCVGCHGDNGTQLSRPCLTCHNDKDLPKAPEVTGKLTHNFSPQANDSVNNGITDKQCLDCHIASDMNGKFDNNLDLTRFLDNQGRQSLYQDSSDFCLRCHNNDHQQQGFEIIGKDYQDPLVAMSINYESIDFHGELAGVGERTYSGLRGGYSYQSKVQCVDCHAMHGTHNEKLIVGSTAIGARKLTDSIFKQSSPIKITTSDGDSSQLCVVCHQMKLIIEEGYQDTGNGLSGVHLTGQECRSCHQHGMATQTGL